MLRTVVSYQALYRVDEVVLYLSERLLHLREAFVIVVVDMPMVVLVLMVEGRPLAKEPC